MNTLPRRKLVNGQFRPASLRETIDVPIVEDNLVCAHCGASIGEVDWVFVSVAKHKGIIGFACKDHVGHVMNLIGSIFGMEKVPTNVQLPDAKEN